MCDVTDEGVRPQGAFCDKRAFGVQITRKAEMEALRERGMGPREGGVWFLERLARTGGPAQEAAQAVGGLGSSLLL